MLLLAVLSLVGICYGSQGSGVLWNKKNCNLQGLMGAVKGNVTDAICARYTLCEDLDKQKYGSNFEKSVACQKENLCMYDNEQNKCKNNRDRKNNVCAPAHSDGTPYNINPICHAITRGVCPRRWQVKQSCCIGANAKYHGILQSRPGFVCCNKPCQALQNSTVEQPKLCRWEDHIHNEQCLPGKKNVFGGGMHPKFDVPIPPKAIEGMFGMLPSKSMAYGIDSPGFGFMGMPGPMGTVALEEMGVDRSKDKHIEEITADDVIDTLISSLNNDADMYDFNREMTSDPWFGKEFYGGFSDKFSFVKPTMFLEKIYGSPFGLSQARMDYGNLYGFGGKDFKNRKSPYGGMYGGGGDMYGGMGIYGGGMNMYGGGLDSYGGMGQPGGGMGMHGGMGQPGGMGQHGGGMGMHGGMGQHGGGMGMHGGMGQHGGIGQHGGGMGLHGGMGQHGGGMGQQAGISPRAGVGQPGEPSPHAGGIGHQGGSLHAGGLPSHGGPEYRPDVHRPHGSGGPEYRPDVHRPTPPPPPPAYKPPPPSYKPSPPQYGTHGNSGYNSQSSYGTPSHQQNMHGNSGYNSPSAYLPQQKPQTPSYQPPSHQQSSYQPPPSSYQPPPQPPSYQPPPKQQTQGYQLEDSKGAPVQDYQAGMTDYGGNEVDQLDYQYDQTYEKPAMYEPSPPEPEYKDLSSEEHFYQELLGGDYTSEIHTEYARR